MYFDRIQAKTEAKQILRTGQPSPLVVTLLYVLLTTGLSLVIGLLLDDPFTEALQYIAQGYDPAEVYAHVFGGGAAIPIIFVTILFSLYESIMAFGYRKYTLRLSRKEEGGYATLMEGFNLAMKVVWLDIVMSFFIVLWSMLFFIPGIIAAYRYSQATYCLMDDPDIGALEAIRRSKQMMRGQKFNLFVLGLTFFGWALLIGLIATLVGLFFNGSSWVMQLVVAIGSLWLTPYQCIVFGSFYNSLTGWGKTQEQPPYQGPELEF